MTTPDDQTEQEESIILQHVGDLGNILADKNGRASFRLEDRHVKVV